MAVLFVFSFFWVALRAFSSGLPSGLGLWCLSLLSFLFSIMSLGLPLFGSFLSFCLIGFSFLGWGGLLVTVTGIIIFKVCIIRFLKVVLLLPKAVAFLIGVIGVFVPFKYYSITCLNINNGIVNFALQVLALKQIICLSYGSGATTLGRGLRENFRPLNAKCGWQNSHTWLHSMVKGIIDSYVKDGGPKGHISLPLFERQIVCRLTVGNIRVSNQNVRTNVKYGWQNNHKWLHSMVKSIINSYVKNGSKVKFNSLFERQLGCHITIGNLRVTNQKAIRGNLLLIPPYLLKNPKSRTMFNSLFERQIVCRITISNIWITNQKAIKGNLLLTPLYFLKDHPLVILFGELFIQIVMFLLILLWQTVGAFVFLSPLSSLY